MKAKVIGAVIILIVGGLALLGWFGYQSFTTGFSAKAEPNALEVLMARQVRYLAIPLEQRNKPNPVSVTRWCSSTFLVRPSRSMRALRCSRVFCVSGRS